MFVLACGSDAPPQEQGAHSAAAQDSHGDAGVEPDSAQDTTVEAGSAQDASPPFARDGSSDAEHADPCRVACLSGGACGALLPSFAPTLDETVAEWNEQFCSVARVAVYEERCADGKRFLHLSTGFYNQRRYFDADGNFLGLTGGGDTGPVGIAAACPEGTYWPARIECPDPEPIRVHCMPGP